MIHTFAALAATFAAKYPSADPTTLASLNASAEQVGSIEAAGVRPYSASSAKLVYVKAIQHFFMPGPTFIPEGDYLQVTAFEAADLVRAKRAELATDEEVAAAQKKGSK